jgi:transposase
LDAKNWLAAVTVALDRVGQSGDLGVIRRWGWSRFAAAVRRELPNHGATRGCERIVRGVFDAATDPGKVGLGVVGQRAGALERVRYALSDLAHARSGLAEVEALMVGVLDELELTALVTSIPGLSAVGAAAILAETGDPTRFSSARALVKHAGLCPRDNSSGTFQGRTGISGRGRPELRLAVWRAIFGALRANPVLAARHQHLVGRDERRLTDTQARIAVGASLLRQLHAVVTTGKVWDPDIASGRTRTTNQQEGTATAA